MADSTSNIPGIVVGSQSKEAQANALFDAASQAMTYGRNAATSSGLTWGYLGGNVVVAAGTRASIANGTLTLTASQTNYIVAAKATGTVSFATNTTNWNNTDDYWRLYSVVTGSATVTSWVDHRTPGQYQGAGSGGGGGGQVDSIVAGTGIDVDGSDPVNPEVSLDAGTLASLGLADTAVQPGDLGDLAAIDLPETPVGYVLDDSGDWVPQSGGGGMTNPMTTAGDIIVGGTDGAAERLALGTDGHALFAGATAPEYRAIDVDDVSGAVADDDSRLTDAREWTADTVEQAEAEAGTATTRRAWTAQRVWQAIAAYISANVASIRVALGFRETLTADRTYYVRTDGSDSNDGLSNTSGGAFLTIQKAVDTAASLDLSIYDVTIRCTGTFTASTTFKTLVGAGKVVIRGDADDMTTMVVSTTSANCFSYGDGFSGVYELRYMRMTAATSGSAISGGGGGGTVLYGNIDFGPTVQAHISIAQGQFCRIVGPITISGGASSHISANDSGQIRENNQTITLTGTPAFTQYAAATRVGSILANGNTYVGSATGKRYTLSTNGVIFTGGAGETYLPGDAAGTTASGGQYA